MIMRDVELQCYCFLRLNVDVNTILARVDCLHIGSHHEGGATMQMAHTILMLHTMMESDYLIEWKTMGKGCTDKNLS